MGGGADAAAALAAERVVRALVEAAAAAVGHAGDPVPGTDHQGRLLAGTAKPAAAAGAEGLTSHGRSVTPGVGRSEPRITALVAEEDRESDPAEDGPEVPALENAGRGAEEREDDEHGDDRRSHRAERY